MRYKYSIETLQSACGSMATIIHNVEKRIREDEETLKRYQEKEREYMDAIIKLRRARK